MSELQSFFHTLAKEMHGASFVVDNEDEEVLGNSQFEADMERACRLSSKIDSAGDGFNDTFVSDLDHHLEIQDFVARTAAGLPASSADPSSSVANSPRAVSVPVHTLRKTG